MNDALLRGFVQRPHGFTHLLGDIVAGAAHGRAGVLEVRTDGRSRRLVASGSPLRLAHRFLRRLGVSHV